MNAGTITILFCIIYYIAVVLFCRGFRLNVRKMSIGGIISAITLILSCMVIPLPTGSTITFGASVPLMILALIGDRQLAMVSGFITGLLCMILVPAWQPVHWAQIFAEHLVCFSCLGFSGIYGNDKKWKVICGCITAMGIKLLAHILAGAAFFSSNAWTGWGAWGYSVSYNLSSGLPELILFTLLVAALPLDHLKSLWKNMVE